MDRLRQHVFEPYPELLVFLTVAVGFQIGRIRYKTFAVGALNERARSQIPGLGRTVPYALGNVLLTVWGSAIVLLVR
ncbi:MULTISPECIES: hypothetical protein [unclassified Streptomyces]|uniref:hypothetical protein n=1 Tax=unclassified Streptomyces TaxID=2593676 RepID=UPI0029BDA6C4|nr:hypothetical protein [Streptomyces sp. DK15]MDX2395121.1 hypothetical protein [Streptomyces sp. DK15]